jgi:hypothetical protein
VTTIKLPDPSPIASYGLPHAVVPLKTEHLIPI